jgi:hypothetical protein
MRKEWQSSDFRTPWRGLLLCLLLGWGGGAGVHGQEPGLELPPGMRFEELEVQWEGGLREGVLTARGRLEGVEHPVRYQQRMRRQGAGWVLEAELQVPASRVEDVSRLGALIPALQEWRGGGTLALEATFTKEGEEWTGSGALRLTDVRLEYPETGLTVDGIYGNFHWRFAEGLFQTPPRQVFTFASIRWGEMETGAGELEMQLISPDELRVELAVVHWAGGRISTGDFSFDPANPDVSINLYANGVQLARLLALLPDFEARGEGVIDGQFRIRLRQEGVRLEPGQLSLRPGVAARLQLPQRAWFTEGMSPRQSNFENLRLVERALEDLSLTQFRLDFLPDEEGQPDLRLHLSGQSASRDMPVAPVSLTLNVHGPVQDIGNWFLNPRVRLGVQ